MSQVEDLLRDAGWLQKMRRSAHRIIGPCPIHAGDGTGAFVVDMVRDRWYCFSRCGRGGVIREGRWKPRRD